MGNLNTPKPQEKQKSKFLDKKVCSWTMLLLFLANQVGAAGLFDKFLGCLDDDSKDYCETKIEKSDLYKMQGNANMSYGNMIDEHCARQDERYGTSTVNSYYWNLTYNKGSKTLGVDSVCELIVDKIMKDKIKKDIQALLEKKK